MVNVIRLLTHTHTYSFSLSGKPKYVNNNVVLKAIPAQFLKWLDFQKTETIQHHTLMDYIISHYSTTPHNAAYPQ